MKRNWRQNVMIAYGIFLAEKDWRPIAELWEEVMKIEDNARDLDNLKPVLEQFVKDYEQTPFAKLAKDRLHFMNNQSKIGKLDIFT